MRLCIVLVAGLVLATAAPRAAEACGEWSMTDKARGVEVSYLINSARILDGKRRVVGAFYFDTEHEDGLRVVANKRVIFDVVDGKLRKAGKPVATLDGATLTFGKIAYTIDLTDPHDWHGAMKAWRLSVRRGSDVVLETADATALCVALRLADPDAKGAGMSEADQHDEIRRRVAYYLAYRHVGL